MTLNEASTGYLNIALLDKNGDPAIPTTLSYSIQCLTNGQEVRASTALTPGTTAEITVTPSDNAIIDDSNAYETRRIIVTAVYGADDELVSYYDYTVKNLSVA
jgi:hypothetical protein